MGPIKDLRTWSFIFCFFSIGLTTRFRQALLGLHGGVAFNVILGFVLSALVFAGYWENLSH